ncbi:unnamed protein product, partial [Notodromas monacha]
FLFFCSDCVRNRLPKRKPGSTGVEVYPSALRPVDSILNDINTMSYYNKHQKILGAGPVGRLSCVSYAGKSPITKRTIRHPPNEDFASLNADILNMSLYPRNQHCALTSEYPARVLACGTRLPPPLPKYVPKAPTTDEDGAQTERISKWRQIEREVSLEEAAAAVAKAPVAEAKTEAVLPAPKAEEEKPVAVANPEPIAATTTAADDHNNVKPITTTDAQPAAAADSEPQENKPIIEETPAAARKKSRSKAAAAAAATAPAPKEPTPPPPPPPPPKEPTPPPPPPKAPTPPPPKEQTPPPPPKEPTPPPPKEPTPPPPPPKEPTPPPPISEPIPTPVEPEVVPQQVPEAEATTPAADEEVAAAEPEIPVDAPSSTAAAEEEEPVVAAEPEPIIIEEPPPAAEAGKYPPESSDTAQQVVAKSAATTEENGEEEVEEEEEEEEEEDVWEMPDEEQEQRVIDPPVTKSPTTEHEELVSQSHQNNPQDQGVIIISEPGGDAGSVVKDEPVNVVGDDDSMDDDDEVALLDTELPENEVHPDVQEEIKETIPAESTAGVIPMRYVLALLNAMGMAIIYGLKVNLSVAIVAMLNHTAIANADGDGHHGHGGGVSPCAADGNGTKADGFADGPFVWGGKVQGLVLGSYFWGYILTQIPGGRLSEMLSAKHLFGIGVLMNAVATILSPIAAKMSYVLFIAMRVVEGIGGGVTFPATHVLLAHWAPPAERSCISSAVYAGTALGIVFSLPFSGILAASLGWESVFYVQGGLSLVWYVLWMLFAYDDPSIHPFISEEERSYILTSLGNSDSSRTERQGKPKRQPVPWKAVFTSMPFWAILIAHTCGNWGWYMLLVELPIYMKSILAFDIKENATLSALPYLCMWLFGMILGSLGTMLKQKNMVSTTVFRKAATALASIVPAICLVAVTYMECNRTAAVGLITIGIMCIAGMYSGYLTNHIDIAPNFAGTLMALTNTVATVPGFIVPVFVGAMTEG